MSAERGEARPPAVAGRMEMTLDTFEHRCLAEIERIQARVHPEKGLVSPDDALFALLSDAVRMKREYVAALAAPAAPPETRPTPHDVHRMCVALDHGTNGNVPIQSVYTAVLRLIGREDVIAMMDEDYRLLAAPAAGEAQPEERPQIRLLTCSVCGRQIDGDICGYRCPLDSQTMAERGDTAHYRVYELLRTEPLEPKR